MKELTSLQIENFKNNLIKKKDDLIKKFKKNNRTKKADKEYYEYEENKFYGLKDARNLFDQNDNDDDFCEEIEYLFNKNGLEYEEIKNLMPVKVKKGYVSVFHQVIEQEEVVNYDVNYYEVNYEYEKIRKVNYIKSRPCLIDCEYIVCEIIEDQKVKDINMLKLSIIESDAIRRLNLTEDELSVIAMLRSVKNYENLSKSSLIKAINKLKLPEEQKKIAFKKYPKKDTRKSFRLKKDIIKKERGNVEFKLRKEGKKSLEIIKSIKNLLLSRKEKKIPKKAVYKPIKISGAFSDNFVEYKSDSKKDKSISIARYYNNIREHLKKLINVKEKKENGRFN